MKISNNGNCCLHGRETLDEAETVVKDPIARKVLHINTPRKKLDIQTSSKKI